MSTTSPVFLQNVPPPSPWFLETGRSVQDLTPCSHPQLSQLLGTRFCILPLKSRGGGDEWVPKPSGEKISRGTVPANEMKPHTIHCFDYLKLQRLGKQMCEKRNFLRLS